MLNEYIRTLTAQAERVRKLQIPEETLTESTEKSKLYSWLRAVGFYRGFLMVSFVPVSMGAVVAWWQTEMFDLPIFALTLAAIWAVHAGANLINDYYDHLSGTDDVNQVRTPFSGGTRVIQEGLLAPTAIRNAAFAAFILGASLLCVLARFTGWPILLLAAAGIFFSFFYSAKPIQFAYRGLGEIVIGLNFGPFVLLTSFFAQTGGFSGAALAAGITLGLLTSAIITINQIPDIEADRACGKMNLVARFGKPFGIRLWAVLLWISLATILAGWALKILPAAVLIALAMIVPVLLITKDANQQTEALPKLILRCRFTILTQLGVWLLMNIGFFVSAKGWVL